MSAISHITGGHLAPQPPAGSQPGLSGRPSTAPPVDLSPLAHRAVELAAGGAALASILYTVSFGVVVRRGSGWAAWTSSLVLLTGSLLGLVVVVAVAGAIARRGEPELAAVAGLVGAAGALGAATHAVFDLANLANPPATANDAASHVDPRGFATFALTGLAMLLAAWLGRRVGVLAPRLAAVGAACGLALIVIFVGRLTLLDPNSGPIAPFALAAGLVLNPLWLLGVGRAFRSARAASFARPGCGSGGSWTFPSETS
jgi:hypothetical protein